MRKRPVLNHALVLQGLVADMGLREFKVRIKAAENPKNVAPQIVFGRSEAQALRIARTVLEMNHTLEIFSTVQWENRNHPSSKFGVYEQVGGFFGELSESDEEEE